jgi:DNA polymerase/3'-5' exonuclease PolX
MLVRNSDIFESFNKVADLLEIEAANPFRVRAYREAARTIGAVHSGFNLSRDKQTERILRAMDNRYFNILAHPTGRLINDREPYALDL